MGRSAAVCALLIAALAPLRAYAQAGIELPPGCGSDGELRSELARLLGPESARKAWPRSLRIARTEQGDYALRLELAGESRSLRDPDCRVLFKTAVVVAAAVIDPSVRAPAEAGARATSPEPAPQPASAPRSEAAAAGEDDDDAPGPSWHAGIALGGGAAFSLLPGVSAQVQLSGTLALGRSGLALGARYMAPATEDGGDQRKVSIYGLGAHLGAFHDPAPWLRLQAGLAADRLTGEGSGPALSEGSTDSGTAVAVTLHAMVVPLRAGSLRVSLGAGGHYAFVRPSFEVTGYGPLFRVPPFGGSAGVELGWEFR